LTPLSPPAYAPGWLGDREGSQPVKQLPVLILKKFFFETCEGGKLGRTRLTQVRDDDDDDDDLENGR